MINVKDSLPDYGKSVLVYHTGISSKHLDNGEFKDELRAKEQKWSNDNPIKFAYRYKTAFSGDKWMIDFPYSGGSYIADDIVYWTYLPEIPEEYK